MGEGSESRERACTLTAGREGRFILGLLFLLFILACGNEEGSPPVLTEVVRPRILPVKYLFNFNEGEAAIVGKVGFEDPDGDVVLLSVTWLDCGREPAKRLEIVQEDLKMKRSGEIPFIVQISTDCPIGVYAVNLSITDGRGYTSNVVPVPYEIKESF